MRECSLGPTPPHRREADELVSRALTVDPNSYHAHQAKSRVLLARWRTEEAIVEAERSLSLNPGFVPAYRNLCLAAEYLGPPEEAIEYADKAMRLSPFDSYLAFFYLFKAVGVSCCIGTMTPRR